MHESETIIEIDIYIQHTIAPAITNGYWDPVCESLMKTAQSAKMLPRVYSEPDSAITRIAKMRRDGMGRPGTRSLNIRVIMAA